MKTNTASAKSRKYVYWLDVTAFERARQSLRKQGIKLSSSLLTPCQALRARAGRAVYTAPDVWSRICVRQGSWYRNSRHNGEYLLVSEQPLPEAFNRYLDSEITETDFVPERLPGPAELQQLVDAPGYTDAKPTAWENKGVKDAIMFKVLFTLTRFWGYGDNLKKYWLSHRANHANFIDHHYTTEIDGESVPYSIAENAGICSSCVEMFNLVDSDARKLVRACPGAVTFGGARRKVYLDVTPLQRQAPA